jgi:hypothetical protein
MPYIASFGENLGLGSSGLPLQASWLHADAKVLVKHNGESLVKELRLTPCYRAGLRKGSEQANFRVR